MDIRCGICAEPWDLDSLHDEADYRGVSFDDIRRDFTRNGCIALGGDKCERTDAGYIVSELADILGDDVDGLASILEDAESLGIF